MGTTYNSAVTNAPIDKVWETVRDFYHLEWAQMDLTVKSANGNPIYQDALKA